MFEITLRNLHPDYKRNKVVRGIRTEYVREVALGVYASHNVLCLKGRYYHGFCITLHLELPNPYLHSPFTVGGRLDHNQSVNRAIQRDLERHMILSDSHQFRKGSERIITRCTTEAEALLLPHYLSTFERSRNALLALAECVVGDTPIIADREAIKGYGATLADWDCDMLRFSELFQKNHQESLPFLMAILGSKPELFQRLRENGRLDPSNLQS